MYNFSMVQNNEDLNFMLIIIQSYVGLVCKLSIRRSPPTNRQRHSSSCGQFETLTTLCQLMNSTKPNRPQTTTFS
uniref:Uncharacterized protein n=1 Tax=Glossina pallidipes TaxID=7398 RepID=A0A1A9Z5L0_GLOPL